MPATNSPGIVGRLPVVLALGSHQFDDIVWNHSGRIGQTVTLHFRASQNGTLTINRIRSDGSTGLVLTQTYTTGTDELTVVFKFSPSGKGIRVSYTNTGAGSTDGTGYLDVSWTEP